MLEYEDGHDDLKREKKSGGGSVPNCIKYTHIQGHQSIDFGQQGENEETTHVWNQFCFTAPWGSSSSLRGALMKHIHPSTIIWYPVDILFSLTPCVLPEKRISGHIRHTMLLYHATGNSKKLILFNT